MATEGNQRQKRLRTEQVANAEKEEEEEEQQQFVIIKVVRDEDIRNAVGKTRYFDLVDHDKVTSFRVPSRLCFNDFKETVARELRVPIQLQRFWWWMQREDLSWRPSRLLESEEEEQSVIELLQLAVPSDQTTNNGKLYLFLEVDRAGTADLHPVPPPEPDKLESDILLFVKLYEPENEELRYVGRLYVKGSTTPNDILAKLNEMAGYPPDQEIDLYEEVYSENDLSIEPVSKEESFGDVEQQDGDIICFQKSVSLQSAVECRYPAISLFYGYLYRCRQAFQSATTNEFTALHASFATLKKELRESRSEATRLRNHTQKLEKQLKELTG